MRGYTDYPRKQRVLIAIGALLVLAGIFGLLSEYIWVGWWHVLVRNVRFVLRGAVPIALIAFGAYLMWASRKGMLRDAVHPRQRIPIRRSRSDRRVCGVCGGFAHARFVDSVYVRIAVLLLFVAFPWFVAITYLLAALLIPSE